MRFRAGRAAAVAAAACCLLSAGCGPKSLSVKSVPFPAPVPVFRGPDGAPARSLPPAAEPARLVVLDFPWCSACGDAWKAVRDASASVPEGRVRVFRILFDRERLFAGKTEQETGPLRPGPPADAGKFPVTTLVALPKAFTGEFRVEQVPVLLLLDADGRVAGRWSGFYPALSADLAREITRFLDARRPPGT